MSEVIETKILPNLSNSEKLNPTYPFILVCDVSINVESFTIIEVPMSA